jgi:hypothetical protein
MEFGKVGLQKGQTLPWAFTPKSFCQKYKITSLGRIGKDLVEVGSTIVFFYTLADFLPIAYQNFEFWGKVHLSR